MRNVWFAALVVFSIAAGSATGTAAKDKDKDKDKGRDDEVTLRASLRGANEVPPINTPATGRFTATIHRDGTIDFTFSYANLSGNPLVSHIHFAQPNVNGGVMIFLCGGGGQPLCPVAQSATITGTITSANVVGLAAQGITAGDLAPPLRVIANGEGYVNIHTPLFPAGEARGQLSVRRRDN